MKFRFLLSSILILFSTSLLAAPPGESSWSKVRELHGAWGSSGVNVHLLIGAIVPNPASCLGTVPQARQATYNSQGAIVNGGTSNYKDIYSQLLAAFYSEKEIQLVIDGDACVANRPKIIAVRVR